MGGMPSVARSTVRMARQSDPKLIPRSQRPNSQIHVTWALHCCSRVYFKLLVHGLETDMPSEVNITLRGRDQEAPAARSQDGTNKEYSAHVPQQTYTIPVYINED